MNYENREVIEEKIIRLGKNSLIQAHSIRFGANSPTDDEMTEVCIIIDSPLAGRLIFNLDEDEQIKALSDLLAKCLKNRGL
jgi:hypothetical protein